MNHTISISEQTKELLDHNRSEGETDEQVLVSALTKPDPAIAVIQFVLDNDMELDDPMVFLRLWNEGEFDKLRDEWSDIDLPDEIFIGADTQFIPKE